MIKGIFCHDLPIYRDKNGEYGCTTLTDAVFKRYFTVVDELVVATRLYHLECTLEEAHQEKITLPNIKFLDIPNLNKPQYVFTRIPKVKKMIEEELKKCELVFLRGGTIADIGFRLVKKHNKAYLYECAGSAWDGLWNYSLLGKVLAPWAELGARKMAKEASFVVYVTEKWLQERYPTDGEAAAISDVVIENTSDEILNKRIDRIKGRKKDTQWVIGTAAGLATRPKGQQFVIEAMSRLRDEINIRYELAGTGDSSYLKSIAKKYNVEDRVIIKGELSHGEILEWMDSLDTYIQPSMQEGLPRALVEAMSRACPCIGSTAGGIPELLEEDTIFHKGNIDELTQVLRAFYKSDWEDHSRYNHDRAKKFQIDVLDAKRTDFLQKYKESAIRDS